MVPKGAILGAEMVSKSIPKRGRNLRAKKLHLETDLGRFGVVLEVPRGVIFIEEVVESVLFLDNPCF